MLKEDFLKFQEMALEDVVMPENPDDILEKNMQIPGMKQKYIDAYRKQVAIVANLEVKLEEAVAKAKNKLKDGEYAYTAKEATEQTALDDDVAKINRALIEQRYYMGWLEDTAANITSLSFTIKNWLKWKEIISTNY
jgi:hypothetical protein